MWIYFSLDLDYYNRGTQELKHKNEFSLTAEND